MLCDVFISSVMQPTLPFALDWMCRKMKSGEIDRRKEKKSADDAIERSNTSYPPLLIIYEPTP